MKDLTLAICLDNKDYEASLELLKLYRVVEREKNDPEEYIRIIDESGEGYLFSKERFEIVSLPKNLLQRIEKILIQ